MQALRLAGLWWLLGVALAGLVGCRARGSVPTPGVATPLFSPPVTPGPASVPPEPTPSPLPSPTPWVRQGTPTQPVPSPTATPSPPPVNQVHRLDVEYEPYWQRAAVVQRLQYTNPTGQELQRLPLLAPALTQSFISLQEIRAEERRVWYQWEWETWTLWLTLDPPLAPDETLDLTLRYVLTLRALRKVPEDNTRPMVQGYTQLQTNMAEWHFIVAGYHPQEAWLLPRVWPFGEFIAYPVGDYTVRLKAPEGWTVAHNGEAFPCEDPAWSVCFRVRAARQAVFSLSTVYAPFERTYTSPWGNTVRLEAYVFQGDRDLGPWVLDVMERAMGLLEPFNGPYHRSRLVFVVGDFPFSMEYDGLFFVRRSFFFDDPELRLTAITVHEVAHQWWYAQVHNDPARGPWMDESLSTYSEVMYYRAFLPQRLDWWWTSYWEGLEPGEGPIDRPLWEYFQYFDYRSLAYLKAAMLWEELHDALGDEGFARLAQAYVRAYRGRIVLPQDLKAFLAERLSPALWEQVRATYFSSTPASSSAAPASREHQP